MLKTLKQSHYPVELIEILLAAKSGIIVANVIAPLFLFFILKDFVPLALLYALTGGQFIIFILRMHLARQMKKAIVLHHHAILEKKLRIYIGLLFISALLLGLNGLSSILYASELEYFISLTIVFALIAGSMSTLSSIYHAVLIYQTTILIINFMSLLLVGNSDIYNMTAFMIAIYTSVTIPASFRIYHTIYNNLQQKKEITSLNASLEETITTRTKELIEKTKELEALNHSLDERVKEESQKLQKNEKLLIQQSRQAAMGEMIGNIAHQWRQPLNTLGLILQNIDLSYQLGDLDDEMMAQSTQKGNRLIQTMSKTIDDFRNFFKPDKQKAYFEVEELIHQSIELVSASYANHFISIETNFEKGLTFYGYGGEFSQVILNILSNAKDALIEKRASQRKVSLYSHQKEGTIMIEIKDNAGGIPKESIEKVFEPYFTTKEEGKGTGIGLYMSKTIIEENMGGKLYVYNDQEGAVFNIIFPKSSQTLQKSDIDKSIPQGAV